MKRTNNDQVVIFDFDGTLADVVPLIREIYGTFAKKHGFPELTEEDFQRLRKGTVREVLKWAGVKPWQLPGLMREGRGIFSKKSSEVELFEGVAQLIVELHNHGLQLYVLSSNSGSTIKQILKRYQIEDYLTVLRRPPLFGKASSIKTLLRSQGYVKSNVFMVGDEVRDIEAAHKAGVNSIAVAWGLQHESALKRAEPTHLVHTVTELKTSIL